MQCVGILVPQPENPQPLHWKHRVSWKAGEVPWHLCFGGWEAVSSGSARLMGSREATCSVCVVECLQQLGMADWSGHGSVDGPQK